MWGTTLPLSLPSSQKECMWQMRAAKITLQKCKAGFIIEDDKGNVQNEKKKTLKWTPFFYEEYFRQQHAVLRYWWKELSRLFHLYFHWILCFHRKARRALSVDVQRRVARKPWKEVKCSTNLRALIYALPPPQENETVEAIVIDDD